MLKAMVVKKQETLPAVTVDGVTYRLGPNYLEIDRGYSFDLLRPSLNDIRLEVLRDVVGQPLAAIKTTTPAGTVFRNKLLSLHPAILGQVNNMISQGMSPNQICNFMTKNHAGKFTIPNAKTIRKYSKWYIAKSLPSVFPAGKPTSPAYKKLKVKVHKTFDVKQHSYLKKGWRNNPMPALGIAILCAEALGKPKTLSKGGIAPVIRQYKGKPIRRENGIYLYDPETARRVAAEYKAQWAKTSEKRRIEGTAKAAKYFHKKAPAQPSLPLGNK